MGAGNMRHIVFLMIMTGLLLTPLVNAYADHKKKHVTPYGDFCSKCTKYGICKTPLSHDEAKQAMSEYYHKKGFIVEVEIKKGRFVRAKIKDRNKVVDVIIFDRHTGRLRSIY